VFGTSTGVSGVHELRRSGPSSIGAASHSSEANPRSDRSTRVHNVELPPLSQLDPEVLQNLPPEIISEMNDIYKGELHGFLKGKDSSSKSLSLPAVIESSVPAKDAEFKGYASHINSRYSAEATKVSFIMET
jgi:DNA repair protein REV1